MREKGKPEPLKREDKGRFIDVICDIYSSHKVTNSLSQKRKEHRTSLPRLRDRRLGMFHRPAHQVELSGEHLMRSKSSKLETGVMMEINCFFRLRHRQAQPHRQRGTGTGTGTGNNSFPGFPSITSATATRQFWSEGASAERDHCSERRDYLCTRHQIDQ